jgi:hypothetical protein
MGGQAFANTPTASGKPVTVPRLSPDLYKTICAKYKAVLETLFERVIVPRDVPWKTSHGDIDFLVAGIRPPTTKDQVWEAIQTALGAELRLRSGGSTNYAIPHPGIPDAHVQIDVELCVGDGTPDSAELFEWTRFFKSDGDLLQIIGIIHRPHGLTCNDKGLHVSIPEIEPYNKKQALLFLTRDPIKALEFYDFVDNDKYWAGFKDEDELFDWASSGRFFSHEMFEARVEKAKDRTRRKKRDMYQRFVDEYMPAHFDKDADIGWTREEVLHDAITAFDKQDEYAKMMDEHHFKASEEALWKDIRTAIGVTSKSLPTILKGLRRWVTFEGGQPKITPEPNLETPLVWSKFITAENKDDVLAWVGNNWEAVKTLEKARANAAKTAAKEG